MRREIDRLRDIVARTAEVAELVAEGREVYDASWKQQYAVVHIIVLAGEAATGLSTAFRSEYPGIPWDGPIKTRNRMIHGYFHIDLGIAWSIASEDMPRLGARVRALIEALEEEASQSDGAPPDRDEPLAREATAVYSSPMAAHYTPAQVADRLAVSKRLVYEWIEEGRLPAQHVSERVTHVSAVALEQFVAAATQPATDFDLFGLPPIFI